MSPASAKRRAARHSVQVASQDLSRGPRRPERTGTGSFARLSVWPTWTRFTQSILASPSGATRSSGSCFSRSRLRSSISHYSTSCGSSSTRTRRRCRRAVTRRVIGSQKGPVILVGHSYGGAVITEAGNDPQVVGLVYVTAFAPNKGESVSTLIKDPPPGAPVPPILPPQDGYLFLDKARS